MSQRDRFKPALRLPSLTKWYDPIIKAAERRYKLMERFVALIDVRPGDQVLDVGCGSGALSLHIKARRRQTFVVGIDADENILSIARRQAATAGLDIPFVWAMSYAMPFADEHFDVVASSLLFHHLTTEDKMRTLLEIRRVLKTRGHLYILDWGKPLNRWQRLAFLAVQLFDGFDTTSDHVKGLLPHMMRQAGFTDVEVVTRISTVGGSLSVYRGSKADGRTR